MRPSTALVIASILACAIAQAGDVYKYVDAQGGTHYTDKPIPGAVRVATGAHRPPEAAAQAYANQQNASNRQLAESNQRIAAQQSDSRAAATVAKDLEASRMERCNKARAAYTQAINSQRLYREGPNGTREYLSDAELAATRVNALKAVESICGPQG